MFTDFTARHAKRGCDVVVSSIFVNPAQFAPTEDLDKYPRTLESDMALLSKENVDVVFVPTVREMYPAGIVLNVQQQQGTFVEVKGMSHQLGVATVVTKLFNVVQPDKAYFGQKDGQQCAVIRSMVRDLLMPIDIRVCQTIRESDGLAMSSRNRYLSEQDRKAAPVLYRALDAARKRFEAGERRSKTLVDIAKEVIASEPHVTLEYVSVNHSLSLEESEFVGEDGAMISGAVKVGKTRIIDNILVGSDALEPPL
ncbi:hypothetical protein HDU96_006209 [Phlyctochytrium bullatum]|nr:hypothetical protein HDU96_006209 [Phlyctochytrium bullatum]